VKTSVDPGASASSSLVGVREEGNIAILDSHAVVQGGKTPLSFDSKSRSLYEVVAGIDGNGDGDLEDSEVCAVFPQKVLTITQNDYDSDKYFLHNVTLLAWGSLPTANTLLDAFLDQDIPGGFTESDDSLEPSDLIHPLGADWTPASSSDCKLFNHDNLTTVLFSYNLRTNIWHDASVHHTSEMINHFNAYPTDDKEWFGPYDFSFPDLSFEKGSAVDDNLYYAFHGVSNATGKYWLEVDDD